jgi:beta-glucanase (GH16 family)
MNLLLNENMIRFVLIVFLIECIFAEVPQTITSPLGKKFTLKFHDEFDAVKDKDGQPYIDRTKWQTTFWQGSSERSLFGNGEAQYYTDKDYNGNGSIPGEILNPFVFEKEGITTIKAWRVPEQLWKKYWMGIERCFASGLLISDKHFDFQYGYVEGRFKLPPNRGTWPAFWLLGNDPSKGTPEKAHEWPPEIDIFEFFGHRPTKHSSAVHPIKGENVPWGFGYNEVGFNITEDFHTWALEWNQDDIVFLFDGKIWARTKTTNSLRRPMYLLINLAVGGTWYSQEMTAAHTPHKAWEVDETTMPWKMHLDYVRVYQ